MRYLPALLAAVLLTPVHRVEAAGFRQLTLTLGDGGTLTYGLLVPDGYQAGTPRPLVLALHPGGERIPQYGTEFARGIVYPAVRDLDPIVVAPDCPTGSWTDAAVDRAVMALLASIERDYTVDRRRVLVAGFSMGGRGTWFMVSHHPELFTAAIPMAASTGDDPVDRLGLVPTYIIHGRRDQVVPFAPAEKNARALEQLGRPVRFEAIDDLTHYEMGGYVPALRRAVRWVVDRWK